MALNAVIRKNWIEIQKKHSFPVSAIGIKIDPRDVKTMKVWKEEKIDQYVKK